MRARLVVIASTSLLLVLLASSSGAEELEATLTLDGLSFLSFGDQQVYSIPAGASLVFRFASGAGERSVPFKILPEDLKIPALPLRGSGEALRFGLAAPVLGSLQLGAGGAASLTFDARLRVQLDHPTEPGMREISIRFTTEASTAKSLDGAKSIAVSGMRVDSRARAVQLVGTKTGDSRDYPVAGSAVYAVLSGVFDALPEVKP